MIGRDSLGAFERPGIEGPVRAVLALVRAVVKVGEEANLAALTRKEWNLLVDLIHSGELKNV